MRFLVGLLWLVSIIVGLVAITYGWELVQKKETEDLAVSLFYYGFSAFEYVAILSFCIVVMETLEGIRKDIDQTRVHLAKHLANIDACTPWPFRCVKCGKYTIKTHCCGTAAEVVRK